MVFLRRSARFNFVTGADSFFEERIINVAGATSLVYWVKGSTPEANSEEQVEGDTGREKELGVLLHNWLWVVWLIYVFH